MKTKRHTFKNYPFLKRLRKEGWVVDNHNKHILIWAFELGKEDGGK